MPRQSEDYQRRLEYVLASRAGPQEAEQDLRLIKALRLGGAFIAAVLIFFVLKGMALATSDRPFANAPPADAGFGAQVHYWFAGADPVTRAFATAIRMDRPTIAQYQVASATQPPPQIVERQRSVAPASAPTATAPVVNAALAAAMAARQASQAQARSPQARWTSDNN